MIIIASEPIELWSEALETGNVGPYVAGAAVRAFTQLGRFNAAHRVLAEAADGGYADRECYGFLITRPRPSAP